MAELNVQQKNIVNQLRQAYPELKSYSDEQILSLYNEQLNNIQLSEDERISIMNGRNGISNDGMGNQLETSQKAVSKEQEAQLKSALTARLNAVSTNVKKAEDSNGFLGKAWSWTKNTFNFGDSSNKVREQQKADLKALESGNIAEAFKQITGLDYTVENVNKFLNNEVQTKSETALNGYTEGQDMASDITSDIISGIAAVGIYTAAVAAAPFTGGASIAVGVVAAGVSAAAIKTGIKYADAKSGGRDYTADNLKKDLATGAFSGVLAPITGGIGGAVGKTAAKALGIQAVKQVGKEVAEEAVEQTAKGFVKTMLTNPTGYEYIGGNMFKRGLAFAAEAATDGAIGGAVDNAFRTAYDGGSLEDIGNSAVEGFVGGAIMSPVIGGGMKVAGKGAQKIFGKNNVEIDANGNQVHVNDDGTVVKIDTDGNEIPVSAMDAEIHIPKDVLAADIAPWKSKLTYGKTNIFGNKPLYFEGKKVASSRTELKKQLTEMGYDLKGNSYVIAKIKYFLKYLKTKEDYQKASILFHNTKLENLHCVLDDFSILESVDDAVIAGMLCRSSNNLSGEGYKIIIKKIKKDPVLWDLYEKGLPLVAFNPEKSWRGDQTYVLTAASSKIKSKEQVDVLLELLKDFATRDGARLAGLREDVANTIDKYIKTSADKNAYLNFYNTFEFLLDSRYVDMRYDTEFYDFIYKFSNSNIDRDILREVMSFSNNTDYLKLFDNYQQRGLNTALFSDIVYESNINHKIDISKLKILLKEENEVDIVLKILEEKSDLFDTSEFSAIKNCCYNSNGEFDRSIFAKILDLRDKDNKLHSIREFISYCNQGGILPLDENNALFNMLLKCKKVGISYYDMKEIFTNIGSYNVDIEMQNFIKELQNNIDISDEFFVEIMKTLKPANLDLARKLTKEYKKLEITLEQISILLKNESEISYNDIQHLTRILGKNKVSSLTEQDLLIATKFNALYKVQNINEIAIESKKNLLQKLISSNIRLFNISENLSKDFPLIPKTQEEYCTLLPLIVRSLGIETNTLTTVQTTKFNQSLTNLSGSLAKISDSDFANLKITQEYSKDKFIKNTLEIVKDLPKLERQKVYDYFGFELHHNKGNQTGFSITGYPVNLNNGKKLAQITDPRTKEIVELLRPDVIKFSEQNPIRCNNPQIEQLLNDVVDVLPELRAQIGKSQHSTHDFNVLQHSLKVLQKISQDPKFKELNESDQKIMMLASLLHDITKREGSIDKTHANESAFDTFFIAKKFNLTREEEIKLYTLAKHHEWLEYVNTSKSEEQLTKRLQSVAYDLQNDNLFDMALMFTHADLRAVKVDDTFHDTTVGSGRKAFDGTVRSYGESADVYAQRIQNYIQELQKSQPLLPVTKIPTASRIAEAITVVRPDGSTNIKGVYKDKDGLIVIKYNEVEDWEAIGFPKGSISRGIEAQKGINYGDTELKDDVNTGNIKFFVHGLDYENQLAKFDAFGLVDSDVLLSISYAERPESKYRFFRAQGVLLDFDTKYVHGGGNTDAGSGCGKSIADFKKNYIFGGHRESDRLYVSNLIKKATDMNDAEYIEFIKANENKPLSEIEPVELRETIVRAFASINSNTRKGAREYNEMYGSNPKEVMAVFAYNTDYNENFGNPVEFLNRGNQEKYTIGTNTNLSSVYGRTEFLRRYALEHNVPFVVFGD